VLSSCVDATAAHRSSRQGVLLRHATGRSRCVNPQAPARPRELHAGATPTTPLAVPPASRRSAQAISFIVCRIALLFLPGDHDLTCYCSGGYTRTVSATVGTMEEKTRWNRSVCVCSCWHTSAAGDWRPTALEVTCRTWMWRDARGGARVGSLVAPDHDLFAPPALPSPCWVRRGRHRHARQQPCCCHALAARLPAVNGTALAAAAAGIASAAAARLAWRLRAGGCCWQAIAAALPWAAARARLLGVTRQLQALHVCSQLSGCFLQAAAAAGQPCSASSIAHSPLPAGRRSSARHPRANPRTSPLAASAAACEAPAFLRFSKYSSIAGCWCTGSILLRGTYRGAGGELALSSRVVPKGAGGRGAGRRFAQQPAGPPF